MASKVIVRDLHKRYDGVHAARGVSFEIRDGEIFGLLGPNGAGKTTTLECVIGLREPDEGTIEVCGIDARKHPRLVKEKIGAALQTTALQDKITPREALGLFGSFYRDRVAPEALLERFSLVEKADASFDSLSGGQRQRLALALAFVNKPALVLLDEPTAGLDPQSRRDLHAEIGRMQGDGHTILLTTHYLDEAEALCDRVAIIDRGAIVATDAPAELIRQSSGVPKVTIRTAGALDARIFDGFPGVDDVEIAGQDASFRTSHVNRALTELTRRLDERGLEIAELHVQKATLESVFLDLLGPHESTRSASE
jgi:ABC-2 type transport system ATP-binding protein